MPSRIFPFVNGQFYHIYNRGTEKRIIFENNWDYSRFIKTLRYYQSAGPKPRLSKFLTNDALKLDLRKKIVDIICYCLMPNHFHLLVRQLEEGGITEFISKLSNSYTKYYNIKHNRVGPLLQGEFKAVMIESDEQLIHVSRYIHLNPLVSYLVKSLDLYRWSSYNDFIKKDNNGLCIKEEILNFFKSPEEYQQFVLDQASYAQDLAFIKHQLLEEEGR